MTLILIMLVLLIVSTSGNFVLNGKVKSLNASPRIEYKEIEVVKRAVCECGHPSSMHLGPNNDKPNEGGCQQEFFELQGKKTTSSFKCFCVKYVGPEPYTDFFDAGLRELDTLEYKELN